MAFRVDKVVSWAAGLGTPNKYEFHITADVDIVSLVDNTATFSIIGTIGIQNYPTQSRNSFAASDFAVLTLGGKDPADYPFTTGTRYYQTALPALPNAPQTYVDAIIAEFRGDTYRADGNNRSSLYIKNSGVVLDAYNGSTYQTFSLNQTFSIDVSAGGNIPILIWNTSGANNATDYSWLQHQVWVSWFDLDYRPGYIYNSTENQLSHNRSTGAANIYTGNAWQTMRTVNGPTGTGNPPLIYDGSAWHNMRRIGDE